MANDASSLHAKLVLETHTRNLVQVTHASDSATGCALSIFYVHGTWRLMTQTAMTL